MINFKKIKRQFVLYATYLFSRALENKKDIYSDRDKTKSTDISYVYVDTCSVAAACSSSNA